MVFIEVDVGSSMLCMDIRKILFFMMNVNIAPEACQGLLVVNC